MTESEDELLDESIPTSLSDAPDRLLGISQYLDTVGEYLSLISGDPFFIENKSMQRDLHLIVEMIEAVLSEETTDDEIPKSV